jgi:ATP-dependent DNA helicase RecQ
VVTFLEERLDDKNLLIDPERYEFRKERYEKRIGEIIRYASSENICRSQFLLSYFGQLDTPICGRCDVCLEEEYLDPGGEEFSVILESLSVQLIKCPMLLDDLVENIPAQDWKIIRVMEYLADEGRVVREKDLTFRWKG